MNVFFDIKSINPQYAINHLGYLFEEYRSQFSAFPDTIIFYGKCKIIYSTVKPYLESSFIMRCEPSSSNYIRLFCSKEKTEKITKQVGISSGSNIPEGLVPCDFACNVPKSFISSSLSPTLLYRMTKDIETYMDFDVILM